MEPSREQLLRMYEDLVFGRMLEDKLCEHIARGRFPTFIHPAQGEEAVGAGSICLLRRDDYLITPHRPQMTNFALKGGDLGKLIAESWGKATGHCQGKGGIMHMSYYEVGCVFASGMIGYNLPVATGVGLSIKMRDTDQVCLNIFGDGASGQGTFHESLNMAGAWKLPVIYLCVNNGFALSTRPGDVFPARIGDRASAYGIPGVIIDGTDVLAVYEATRAAVDRARRGDGPSLIEAVCWRWREHSEGMGRRLADRLVYRTKEESEQWEKKDPVKSFRDRLVSQGILTQETIDDIAQRIDKRIDDAFEFARVSPRPNPEDALTGVFGTTY